MAGAHVALIPFNTAKKLQLYRTFKWFALGTRDAGLKGLIIYDSSTHVFCLPIGRVVV